MVRTKIFVKEDTKMLYTEKEKHEIERVKEVFAEHLRQSLILNCSGRTR